jgi:uncharacterized protein (TIGR02466 family)
MNYLKGIPITHNGIFIYDLDINNSNILNYLNISFFNNIEKDEAEHSYITKSRSVLNDLPDLKNEISKAINHLINEVLKTKADFSIYSSWGTQTLPNGFSSSHTHSNSWISGVYYPSSNENFNIKVYNDYLNQFYSIPSEHNIYNTKEWLITPKENQLILFFSNLRHKILFNKSNEKRYSIAFNVLPTGNFGVGDSEVNFNIS